MDDDVQLHEALSELARRLFAIEQSKKTVEITVISKIREHLVDAAELARLQDRELAVARPIVEAAKAQALHRTGRLQ